MYKYVTWYVCMFSLLMCTKSLDIFIIQCLLQSQFVCLFVCVCLDSLLLDVGDNVADVLILFSPPKMGDDVMCT